MRLVPNIESMVLRTPSNRLTRPFPKDSKPPIISPDKKFVTPEKTSASELTSPATIPRAGPSICNSTSASDDITGIIGDNAPSIRPITADSNFPTAEITVPSGSASSATSSRIGVKYIFKAAEPVKVSALKKRFKASTKISINELSDIGYIYIASKLSRWGEPLEEVKYQITEDGVLNIRKTIDERRRLILNSVIIPIAVSIVTNLSIILLQWLLS